MTERYPDYDVLAKQDTPSWNEATRRAIAERLGIEPRPQFFSPEEWETLEAICARILPQPQGRDPVPLAAYVDEKLLRGRRDGYRPVGLPPQGEAWRRGLAALEAEATANAGQAFALLDAPDQDALLKAMQGGLLKGSAWGGMACDLFFGHRVLPDITRAYYAHPSAWSEIGFGGPASPRGYVRMGLDRRDPWEASEARPGREAKARTENSRVGRG
jgi:hypothetical protein